MPKIFLSSTFIDLDEIRKEVSHWLMQVFGADLIIMETFGSDADPPDVISVRRVRQCDLFIGIYARRYGTIETVSAKSITELELDEAERAHSSGTIRDILIYILDPSEGWPDEFSEKSRLGQSKLTALKKRAKAHTCSYFKSKDDLLLSVTRDTQRKFIEHFTVSPLQVRQTSLPKSAKLVRPIGMEFLSSRYRQYLAGRDSKVEEILRCLDHNHLVLLLADSGLGKTSLVQAGLVPATINEGWTPIYTRSFGFPATDVLQQIQSAIFEGRPNYRGPLNPLLTEIASLLPNSKLLLVIDQFEDILIARDEREVARLISDLRNFNDSNEQSIRMLLVYRADLEGRLGPYWQAISGSPEGLPRIYLGGLQIDNGWSSIITTAIDLGIQIDLSEKEEHTIKKDLESASRTLGVSGIYPPYLQMMVDHLWTSTSHGREPYTNTLYTAAKGVDGVIGGYLARQLEYAQDSEGNVRLVLISLVRSYGVKAQRTLKEITADTGLTPASVDLALERLIDLRLVRHIEDYYEVSHDFIAKRILIELVDTEEQEVKRFRELLTSKAAAFATTRGLLTREELLMLFKYRQRIIPTEAELRLLLASWIGGAGPGLYWLFSPQARDKISPWLSTQELTDFANDDVRRDAEVWSLLLGRKLEERPFDHEDYKTLQGYQYGLELTFLLMKHQATIPTDVIFAGLRHKRSEVSNTCKEILIDRVRGGDWNLVERIRVSSGRKFHEIYDELVLRNGITPTKYEHCTRAMVEFGILRALSSSNETHKAEAAFKQLKKLRPRKRAALLGEGMYRLKRHGLEDVLRMVQDHRADDADAILHAIPATLTRRQFALMLKAYELWNLGETERAVSITAKAKALAEIIERCMNPLFVPLLRKTVKRIRLAEADSSRYLVHSLLRFGVSQDVAMILDRIAREQDAIYFHNHTELGRSVAKRMAKAKSPFPRFLSSIIGKREFWQSIHGKEREKVSGQDLLPVRETYNRALYIRLVAYTAIGASSAKDTQVLLKLSHHRYGLVARAASLRLVQLLGEEAIRELAIPIRQSLSEGKTDSVAAAIRYAEIEFYGVAHLW